MDGVNALDMTYAEMSKKDRDRVRAEMIRQAEKMLAGRFSSSAQLMFAARKIVDMALAQERRGDGSTESSNPQLVA